MLHLIAGSRSSLAIFVTHFAGVKFLIASELD